MLCLSIFGGKAFLDKGGGLQKCRRRRGVPKGHELKALLSSQMTEEGG